MGTYTTHLELYKPTVGENGWGDLVNENFDKIDTAISKMAVVPKMLITVTPTSNVIPSSFPSGTSGNDDTCYDSFHLLTYVPNATYTGTVSVYADNTQNARYYKIEFVLADGSINQVELTHNSSVSISIPNNTTYAMICFGTDNNGLKQKVVYVKTMTFDAQYVIS